MEYDKANALSSVYHAFMSGHPATGPDSDDPFKGLEGLGEDLEDTFAELDARVTGSGAADGKGSSDSSDDKGGSGGWQGSPGWQGDIGDLGSLGISFGGVEGLGGLFNTMGRMLQNQHLGKDGLRGSIGSQARGIGRAIATENRQEPNADPDDRISVEQLMRVAEMHVAEATGLDPPRGLAMKIDVVNRAQWVDRTIDDYTEILGSLAKAITAGVDPVDAESEDSTVSALLAGIGRLLGPTMASITVGTMLGSLAQRALGGYVLPLPRPESAPLLILLPNVDEFSRRWSLSGNDLRLWVCLNEAVYHTVFGVEHVRTRLEGLLLRYAAAFDGSFRRVEHMFENVDLDIGPEKALAEIQAALNDPEEVLNIVRSPEQEALLPELTALVAAVNGYVDYMMDSIGATLISLYGQFSEALRRHRAETSAADRFSEQFLGLELGQSQYERGATFARGVVERAGQEGLDRLFSDPANLPTPAEVDAPGLWLARIDLA